MNLGDYVASCIWCVACPRQVHTVILATIVGGKALELGMGTKGKIVFSVIITFMLTVALCFGALTMAYFRLSGDPAVAKAKAMIDMLYYEDVPEQTLSEGAIVGMMASLDRYSYYVREEEYEALMEHTNGQYKGLGIDISIGQDDRGIAVKGVYSDTPAERAGLVTGDLILVVDGQDVTAENYVDVIRRIKSDENDQVQLGVRRVGSGQTESIIIIKEMIQPTIVSGVMLVNKIGYIHIDSFEITAYDQFVEAVETLTGQGMQGLVLDLRFNPGGSDIAVTKIADYLLPQGLISYFEAKDGTRQEYTSDAQMNNVPLVVLINGSSASASELLAGAVKDYDRGKLIGEKTFGKGVVQSIIPFSKTEQGTSALYITTARYFTPSGECIHEIGIEPDIQIQAPEGFKLGEGPSVEADIQLKTAVQELQKQIG